MVIYERFDSWWQFPYLVWVLPLEHDKSARNVKLAEEQPVGAEHFAYLKLFLSSNQPNSIENLRRNLMTLLPLLLLTLHEICFLIVCYSIFSMAPTFPPKNILFPLPLSWFTVTNKVLPVLQGLIGLGGVQLSESATLTERTDCWLSLSEHAWMQQRVQVLILLSLGRYT